MEASGERESACSLRGTGVPEAAQVAVPRPACAWGWIQHPSAIPSAAWEMARRTDAGEDCEALERCSESVDDKKTGGIWRERWGQRVSSRRDTT